MIYRLFTLVAVGAFALGCMRDLPKGQVSLQKKLGLQDSRQESDEPVTYVSRFENTNDAEQHAAAMRKSGADVRSLDAEGRVLVVTAKSSVIAHAAVSENSSAALNTKMSLKRSAQNESTNVLESANDAQAFLTARRVTGVSELVGRIPEADGRNVKVAVFDTGIDFGIEGVDLQRDGSRKMAGFFDLTGFGKVTPAAAVVAGNQITIEGKILVVADEIGATEITSAGVLSEKQLATDYMTADGVDLNGNEAFDDTFFYVVGRNRDGAPAVWIDANNNAKIDSRLTEELTDYNTSFRSIPMSTAQPSGARPLAVTIAQQAGLTSVQFHSVPGGHGSSCAIIIAGDGYADGQLQGMAPKAQLVSYMLDATGQDVYTIDEFLAMFLHARSQNVDAISISWGFATADLASARFVSDFLDKEIAARGIVVGIAAGNEGPGISSGLNDDYVPHHGFAVGAYISEDQARNIYGWTGNVRNDVIWYSSVGPSRGGRQVPDVVSPLMTLVRGERGPTGQQFYGFGGTSSATPALIGSVSALMSALKIATQDPIDVRLLKLAVTNTAAPLDNVDAIRTGAGLIDVSKAYDKYLSLYAELKAAKADSSKRTKFAYDVRASTALDVSTVTGEGIHFKSYRPFASVSLALTSESLQLVDPLVFYEPVMLQTEGEFFEVQDVIGLQAGPVGFDVRFKQDALSRPGTYTGKINVVRASDQTVLTVFPIVIEIPALAVANGALTSLRKDFEALDVWRQTVRLDSASAIEIRGVALDDGLGHNGDLRFVVVASDSNVVSYNQVQIKSAANIIDLSTATLPAGSYEILAFRTFRQPAVLTGLSVNAVVTLPSADVLNAGFNGQDVQLLLSARHTLAVKKAKLILLSVDVPQTLVLGPSNAAFTKQFKAYYGETLLPVATDALAIRLVQNDFNAALNPSSNVELVAVNKTTSEILYRGWTNFGKKIAPATAIEFPSAASEVVWAAWSNIVDWNRPDVERDISLVVTTSLPTPIAVETDVSRTFSAGQSLGVSFAIPESLRSQVRPGVTGSLILLDSTGATLESLDVRL